MSSAISLHQLQLFMAVARERSFSRAAEVLGTTQPSVSIQIRNLEGALGVRLFDRLGRAIYLTPAGEMVLEYSRRIFSLTSSMQSDLENLNGVKMGRLLVGASRVPSTTAVPLAFALFKNTYPHTEIVVKAGVSNDVEQWVLKNEVDLGVIGGNSFYDAIKTEPYYEEELLVVLSSKHPLAKQSEVFPEQIVKECLLLPYTGRVSDLLEKALAEKGLSIDERVTLGSREAVKAALSMGFGISIMPESAAKLSWKPGLLSTKKIHGLKLKYPLSIVYHKDKHLSKLALTFVEFLRRAIASKPF